MKDKSKQWNYTGDVSPESYGGKWYRRTHDRVWQVIELTNMDDACGHDNEGHDTYVVELSLVDLDAIPIAHQERAWECCGYELPTTGSDHEIDNTLRTEMTAIACYEYGCKAPLESWSGNGYTKLLRLARSAAKQLLDEASLQERMTRTVNKIGSTAREYMTGDLSSAILRGVSEGDPTAELMLKLGVK